MQNHEPNMKKYQEQSIEMYRCVTNTNRKYLVRTSSSWVGKYGIILVIGSKLDLIISSEPIKKI